MHRQNSQLKPLATYLRYKWRRENLFGDVTQKHPLGGVFLVVEGAHAVNLDPKKPNRSHIYLGSIVKHSKSKNNTPRDLTLRSTTSLSL